MADESSTSTPKVSNSQRGACSELLASTYFLNQGADVFRNFTFHGPIDILVFWKDTGRIERWDVKTWNPDRPQIRRLTREQHALGVRLLFVNPVTGECFPDNPPLPPMIKDFFFIHCPKNAGSSIGRSLKAKWAENFPEERWKHGRHITARRRRRRIGAERWDAEFTFGARRNPWARVVSLHAWQTRYPDLEFDFWVKAVYEHQIISAIRSSQFLPSQVQYFCDSAGEVLVNELVEVEKIDEQFPRICEGLEIEPFELPTKNTSHHAPYTELYTDETRALIAEVYKDDIEKWGYTFEDGLV